MSSAMEHDGSDGEAASVWPAVDLLKGTELEWSTVIVVTGEDGKPKNRCIFCNREFTGGPANIRTHADMSIKPRNIRACKPTPAFAARHGEVLAVLRARTAAAQVKAAIVAAKESARAQAAGPADPAVHFFKMATPEAVAKAWMKVIVKKALPLDLLDDRVFRQAVEMTAKSGSKNLFVGGKLQLPHRTYMTQMVLPAVDDELSKDINGKVQGLASMTGVTLISDGWTNVSNKPIINALASLPLGSYFLTALDTTGKTKDAQFIADFMIEQIQQFGADKVVAVCMDGACTASFPLITRKVPHVFNFICPAHSLDNFMKNMCSDKPEIIIKSLNDRRFKWGEPMFAQVIEKVGLVVKFITNHQKPLARYRDLAAALAKEDTPPGGTELLKSCDTRFASNVMVLIRYKNVHFLLEQLVIDKIYSEWLEKQPRDMRNKGGQIKQIIRDENVIETVGIGITIMEPVLRLLRLTDGKTGATLSKVYNFMLQLDVHLRNEIPGLACNVIRHKIHELFMARWEYMHRPVMTAAFRLDPEFARRKFSRKEQDEVKAVLKQMATEEHPYPDLLSELADFEEALGAGLHDLEDAVAFSVRARAMAPYKWAKVYLSAWPHLQWASVRLLALSCSASGCERSWSVEDWIHSKKRNRLGQGTVERLVRCHTNILLQDVLEDWEANVLAWDIEMVPEEPEE